jgi:hypothetical protein
MKNPASVQLNNNEDVGGPEEEIMDHGEVTGPNLSGVIPEKSRPGLVRLFPFLGHIPLNGAFADFEAVICKNLIHSALGYVDGGRPQT